MPFIPHTDADIQAMLATIGIKNCDELFGEIPKNLKIKQLKKILPSLNEMEICQLMHSRAKRDRTDLCFIGAGAYEHHIPAAVWEIAGRGEFMTAYTPYQAEASQGTLQTIYEYQTMMANLTGMDVSNASLYDGASAVGEAALMAVRANRKSTSKKILVPRALHPTYRSTAKTIAGPQGVEFIEVPFATKSGAIDFAELNKHKGEDFAAVIIAQPNFFGVLEDVDKLTDWAHANNALVIAVVNPVAIVLLKEPGSWGETGADIVVGDGQPLGCPLAAGGPYFGFMCCKNDYLRTMPGRVIGKTTDTNGNEGYVLNLQAREQHIRRSKATSNICTNQGLMATAATIFMSIMGADGLRDMAIKSHQNSQQLQKILKKNCHLKPFFAGSTFHEFVIKPERSSEKILTGLAEFNIQGGYDLSYDYPELKNCMLLCATETKSLENLKQFAHAFKMVEESL